MGVKMGIQKDKKIGMTIGVKMGMKVGTKIDIKMRAMIGVRKGRPNWVVDLVPCHGVSTRNDIMLTILAIALLQYNHTASGSTIPTQDSTSQCGMHIRKSAL
eukprot:713876-Rhodomonas_salina.3